MEHKKTTARALVRDLGRALDKTLPDWRQLLEDLEQASLVRARAAGWRPTDLDAMHGLLLAFLSAMTDWRRIQAAKNEILTSFDWHPLRVAELTDDQLASLHRWFVSRRLGSLILRKQLVYLRLAAAKLVAMAKESGSVEAFLSARIAGGAVIDDLAAPRSRWKLPGVGIALAAEFLKNLGHDDFKPDRHLLRILGPTRLALVPNADLHTVRMVGRNLAHESGVLATELDQMLWLYCARGYANVCGAEPRCNECLLAPHCMRGARPARRTRSRPRV
jgi:endonuclease III